MNNFIAWFLISAATSVSAATLQQRIDSAAPNDTILIDATVHAGPITINKPLQLIGRPGAEIRGNGTGNVITITADDVTVRGFRITGSGLRLSDDNAAVFVAGNRATIENNVIENSLHGVYLKKVRDCRVIGNRIRGKTTLLTSIKPIEQTLTAGIGELCETSLNENERGNGIHQWSCERNLDLRQRNQRHARRHLLFLHQSFASGKQPRAQRPLRPALHVFRP